MKLLSSRRINCIGYPGRVPFEFTVIDGLFLPDACRAIADSFPKDGWVDYDSPLERKSVCNDRSNESPAVRELYAVLSDDGFLDILEQITDKIGLVWDESLHAAGLCVTGRGGKLDVHRDALAHPAKPLERALTALLFLNDHWDREWGGNLELWSERDGFPFELKESIEPKLGRLVLFDPNGYHGYPDPITCPEEVTRKSVQVFYWRQASERVTRQRAAFAPRPSDKPDPSLDRLRAERLQPRGM